jgi:hypothetical protein
MAEMFLAYGNNMLRALSEGGRAAVLVMAKHAVENELSFSKAGPPVFPGLRWQTGHLRRTVAASPRVDGKSDREAWASFGTTAPYGIKHEQGFEGTEHVAAHTRRVATRSVFAKVDGKRRKVAQGVAYVRAHDRFVTIRARRYLGRTLETDTPLGERLIDRSLWLLITEGKVPSAAEVMQSGGIK